MKHRTIEHFTVNNEEDVYTEAQYNNSVVSAWVYVDV